VCQFPCSDDAPVGGGHETLQDLMIRAITVRVEREGRDIADTRVFDLVRAVLDDVDLDPSAARVIERCSVRR
jgi:hypothetical protein